MKLATLTLAALLTLGACGGESPKDSPKASATVSAAAGTDANGFPAGFAYPPDATVEQTAPQHSLYIVAGATTEAIEDYWVPHLESLGFEKADETEGSATYQRGTTTVQVTWNQAGDEVRGAANVVTP